MRSKLIFFVAAATCFGTLPFTPRLGPVVGSVALVALAVALSIAASAGAVALTVAGGALGAFAAGMLGPACAGLPAGALAGAVLTAFCFGERTLRVRSPSARVLHLGAALVGGAIAGALTTTFALAALPVHAVAVIVAAVVLALPLLVPADDPLAHALGVVATDLLRGSAAGPVVQAIEDAAELRRALDQDHEDVLDAPTTRQVRATWAALLRLAEARVRLARAGSARAGALGVVTRLDERIVDHAKALSRAYGAYGAAKAAELSLDDAALRTVESAGESLEAVSRAIVEQG